MGEVDKVIEENGRYGLRYYLYRNDSKIAYKKVNIRILTQEKEGFIYIFIIDSMGLLIQEAHEFLNIKLNRKSYAERTQAATALKLLYSFIEVYGINKPYQLTYDDITTLDGFLSGGYQVSNDIEYQINTKRSSHTINIYYNTYRKFYKIIYWMQSNPFSEVRYNGVSYGRGMLGHTNRKRNTKYTSNRKVLDNIEVPKYISFDEFNEMLKIISKKYSLREELFFKLMYVYGLRVGEVHGLTLEDIECIGKECKLILRNRLSDKRYQHAKRLMNIKNISDYHQDDYWKQGVGFETVPISLEMYNLLKRYISETTSPFDLSKRALMNRLTKEKADKVTEFQGDNLYIFVSKNYTRITDTGWNNIIKQIFEEAGITIDQVKKEDNLNHRLRHGFAMFKIFNQGYTRQMLRAALRQKNENSVEYYFNPTQEDLRKMHALGGEFLKEAGVNIRM